MIRFDFLVTVYWNYIGDNGGMLLNPQRFHSSMPLVFGPAECYSVLKTIFDSSTKCSFQPTSFINRIRDLFSSANDTKGSSSTPIKCNYTKKLLTFETIMFIVLCLVENGTIVNVPLIEKEDDFWDIIRIFQNCILAGNDLFISTSPQVVGNQSKCLFELKNSETFEFVQVMVRLHRFLIHLYHPVCFILVFLSLI